MVLFIPTNIEVPKTVNVVVVCGCILYRGNSYRTLY